MSTSCSLGVLARDELDVLSGEFEERGIALVVGSVIDMAGVGHVKAVPLARLSSFHRTGIGASPSWNVFCIDNAVALTPDVGVVGDMRLRLDPAALTTLDDAIAWAPVEMFDQQGLPVDGCARGQLRKVQAEAEAESISALVGTEVEFAIVDDTQVATDWQGYGARAFLERREFLLALHDALSYAGIVPEQLHAEYGVGQYEVSFSPAEPLRAADTAVLARLVIGETARRCGLRVSFSPLPFADGAGNGAHLHMSFHQNGQRLLSGGSGRHGLTKDGAAALAGIVTGLPEMLAVFAGSIVSSHRLQPGRWSGAHACWGVENREAAVRLCAVTPTNPGGANIELKCVDTSANPYLSIAAMLGMAVHGIRTMAVLPEEVSSNPAELSPGIAPPLARDYSEMLDQFARSALARSILGDAVVDATVAVRRHEFTALGDVGLAELCKQVRYCWSM